MVNQNILKEYLNYNKDNGLFYWIKKTNAKNRAQVGSVAGGVNKKGYYRVSLFGRYYQAHRLAWLYIYGWFPVLDIDHINGIKTDNRIENLRIATDSENKRNQGKQLNNKSGFKGVVWKKSCKKWMAQARFNGKVKYLGLFDDIAKASSAYDDFAKSNHKEFYFKPCESS